MQMSYCPRALMSTASCSIIHPDDMTLKTTLSLQGWQFDARLHHAFVKTTAKCGLGKQEDGWTCEQVGRTESERKSVDDEHGKMRSGENTETVNLLQGRGRNEEDWRVVQYR